MVLPILNGVTLPAPSSHAVQLMPVSQEVELADGSTSRYHRGHRTRITMRWRMVKADVRDQIVELSRLREVTQYVDIDGAAYVVRVDDSDGVDTIAATNPVRYDVGLTLVERRPR